VTTSRMAEGFSTLELKAAAEALEAGWFRPADTGHRRSPLDVQTPAGDPPPLTRQRPSSEPPAPDLVPWLRVLTGHLVVVWPAHPGAGATTLALAIAEAAAVRGPTRLLDTAGPSWSALVSASTTELGCASGWRRGRRRIPMVSADRLIIDRVDTPATTPDASPPPTVDARAAFTVLDIGWGRREIDGHPGWLNRLQHRDGTPVEPLGRAADEEPSTLTFAHLVVCRASAHALRQAEATLARLPSAATRVALIGAPRRVGDVILDAGPRLRSAWECDAVHPVPRFRDQLVLDSGALPRQLRRSGEQLLAALTAPHASAGSPRVAAPRDLPDEQPLGPRKGPTDPKENR
jgi:hypothetical protein